VLTTEELAALTGRKRPTYQAKVLDFMGIRYTHRPDGSLVVHQAHVDAALGVVAQSSVKEAQKRTEPYWGD
jgi:Domain of unknown function (DUF4224)